MKLPLTINPLKYYDNDTGKPTGEEYWILDADGEEIACMDKKEDARRIVAAVNAVEGIETETLELLPNGLASAAENDRLQAQNARLLEALKLSIEIHDYVEQHRHYREKHEQMLANIRAAKIGAETKETDPITQHITAAQLQEFFTELDYTRQIGELINVLKFLMSRDHVVQFLSSEDENRIRNILKPYEQNPADL